jgi:hypothetical protein
MPYELFCRCEDKQFYCEIQRVSRMFLPKGRSGGGVLGVLLSLFGSTTSTPMPSTVRSVIWPMRQRQQGNSVALVT